MKSKKGTNVLIGLAVQLQILLVLRKIQWIKLAVSRQFSIQHGGWRKNGTIGKLTSRTGSTTRWLDLDTIVIVGLGLKATAEDTNRDKRTDEGNFIFLKIRGCRSSMGSIAVVESFQLLLKVIF